MSYYYNNPRNIYWSKQIKIYRKVALDLISKLKLQPNFDIKELFNKLGIEIIPAKKLPFNWEYAFNNDNNQIKLYYLDKLHNYSEGNEQEINNLKRDLKFVLAYALADILFFYGLKEENLIKKEYEGKTYCQGIHPPYPGDKDSSCEYFAAFLLMPEYLFAPKYHKLSHEDFINKKENCNNIYNQLGEYFGVNYSIAYTKSKRLY